MKSTTRRSRNVHGALTVTTKKLSLKRYKRVVCGNPELSDCHCCGEKMTRPSKAVCINIPLDNAMAGEVNSSVIFLCKKCSPFKADIARAYAARKYSNNYDARLFTGGLV
jgi:hypothetical protein|tara:strand:- start:101 stop:430 length:330 start_codon:yes stop_codon:yes gene_type:complete